MNVTVDIIDQRQKPQTGAAYYGQKVEMEEYERVSLQMTGSAGVIADALRAIADDLVGKNEARATIGWKTS